MAEIQARDVAAIVRRFQPEIEAFLRESIPSDPVLADMYGMLGYHLGWVDSRFAPIRQRGGKQLRPVLCLLSCEAVGADRRRAIPAAGAVELFHNFSLVHDDVEDRSDERRGRPTVRALWGDPRAVNAGDALLVLTELALARAPSFGVDADLTLALIREANRSFLAVAEGQHLDLTGEGNPDLSRARYDATIRRKTAELIGAAARLGALSGGAPPDRAEHFYRFGIELGLAFQVQDDILGIWGDPGEVGKGVAADVYGRKITLPVIVALERASSEVAARVRQVYRSVQPSASEVDEVVGYLTNLGGREAADAEARSHVDRALEELDRAKPRATAGEELRVVAQALIGRTS